MDKKHKHKLIEKGLCLDCRKPVEGKKQRCSGCLIIKAEYAVKYRETKKKAGVCCRCGKQVALNNNILCFKCKKKANDWKKDKCAKLKKAGVCIDCGNPRMEGLVRCQLHHELNFKSGRDRVLKLSKNGFCTYCGKNSAVAKNKRCIKCILCAIAYSIWKTRSKWNVLLKLFDKQGGICPYSGDLLTIGNNASVDHIIPVSKGGTNDISNLQWVETEVNMMKKDHYETDFLNLIKKIVSFRGLYSNVENPNVVI